MDGVDTVAFTLPNKSARSCLSSVKFPTSLKRKNS